MRKGERPKAIASNPLQSAVASGKLSEIAAGVYDYVVFADGVEVDRQRFIARLAEDQSNGSKEAEPPSEW